MTPNPEFLNKDSKFWANVKIISQVLGYTHRNTNSIKIYTKKEIIDLYNKSGFSTDKLIWGHNTSSLFLKSIINYFEFRADVLNNTVQHHLMSKKEAEKIYNDLKNKFKPLCHIPMNKQKGDKQTVAFFTAIINMLIEKNSKGYNCNYNPMQLVSFTDNNRPCYVISRRVDGSFPSIVNPVAVWEIKEYYNTTTFGSRVADGVYESQLDGYELNAVQDLLNKKVYHYLMVDDHYTWWTLGKSYLCRIIDMLHMGLLDEALFGREVITRIPIIVNQWIKHLK